MYVDAPQQVSAQALDTMKRELRSMLNSTNLGFDFITPDQAKPPAYFQSLVSVKMTGVCSVDHADIEKTRGPLAFAHSSDGRILPFVEVQCDRVRRHVRDAFWGPDAERSEYLYGRALARVLAHELYHVLTGRKEHTPVGFTRKALSGGQLIADDFPVPEATVDLISNCTR
jgi:hypothetical protein